MVGGIRQAGGRVNSGKFLRCLSLPVQGSGKATPMCTLILEQLAGIHHHPLYHRPLPFCVWNSFVFAHSYPLRSFIIQSILT
uniref:Uncharacterized protein n=1 Tax=Arundo donax TaxID=35708 RepID=A0A0A9D5G5_ARUDO